MEEWAIWFYERDGIDHASKGHWRKVRAAFWRCAWIDLAAELNNRTGDLVRGTPERDAVEKQYYAAEDNASAWEDWGLK